MTSRIAALVVSFALAAACRGEGGTDNGKGDPSPLPHVLYDRGPNRPTVLTEHGDTLYWAESSPDEGPCIMRAPKDGSAQPEMLGTRSPYDIADISATDRHVFWQDNGLLIAFDLAAKERKELGRLADDGYGGPSLSVDDEWAAFADSSCRSVTTVRLSTGELFHARVHEELRGGRTSLIAVEGSVLCANGPEIVRVVPGTTTFERVWQSAGEGLGVYGLIGSAEIGIVFQLARTSVPRSMFWTSLQRLEPAAASQTALMEFPGIARVDFTFDVTSNQLFLGPTSDLKPLETLHLQTGHRSTLPGEAYLGILTSDETYLYWSEDDRAKRENPKNAIYRQRKPELE